MESRRSCTLEAGVNLLVPSIGRAKQEIPRVSRLALSLFLFCLFAVPGADTRAQSTQLPQTSQPKGSATVVVNVVADTGGPLDNPADVMLSLEGEGSGQIQSSGSNGVARFSRVPSGNYTVSVRATGFKEGVGAVQVPMNYGSFETTVVMQPDIPEEPDAKGTVLAPKARKELNAGLAAMRLKHYDEAQGHFEAAYKLAPGDPEVNDWLGELFLVTKDFAKAQDYLARALSLDPEDIRALTDMGQLRIGQSDYVAAEPPLQEAITLAPQNWFAHWMLGVAYLRLNENEKARLEALAAMKFGKGAANDAGYLLGEALAALGRNGEAIKALQLFLKASPNNSYAPAAQALIVKLQSGQTPPAAQPAAENLIAAPYPNTRR
jgi:Flp pilus assembly protein TadD